MQKVSQENVTHWIQILLLNSALKYLQLSHLILGRESKLIPPP